MTALHGKFRAYCTNIYILCNKEKEGFHGTKEKVSLDEDSEDEEDGSVDFDQKPESDDGSVELNPNHKLLVETDEIRKYKNSHVKNDALQEIIKEHLGKYLELLKDCKTRWSSLLFMLERFIKLAPCIRSYCIQNENEDWPFKERHMKILKDLVAALKPIEAASTALSSRDCCLIQADAIYQELLDELQNNGSAISNQLKMAIVKRIGERRNPVLVHLIHYLQDPSYLSNDKDYFGHKIKKTPILMLAKKIVNRLFPDHYRTEEDDETQLIIGDTEQEPVLSFTERLKKRMKLAKEAKPTQNVDPSKKNVENEFKKFEQDPMNRPVILEKLYEALKGIPVVSVEAERCFSTTGNFATKLRSNLGDKSLDSLVFLKHNK